MDEIESRIAAASNGPRGGGGRQKNVAVLPIYGVISPRQDMMARTSGGTTAESILSDFRAALRDPEIDGIVFDVDSPGGAVEGIDELAAEIRGARGQKPMAAVANHMAASAAYWAVAGVDELVATPSASVGSIGIFTAHQDMSAALEQAGVRTTLISAGKYKVEGNRFEPLAEEAKAAIQADVDAWYQTMTGSIAKSRGVPVDTVRANYGEGRTLMARKALDRGMVDRIDSLDNTIRRVARGTVGASPKAAALAEGTALGAHGVGIPDALASGLPFAERLALASALASDVAEQARKRADLRAEEGRALSEATRQGLSALADSLRAIADEPPATDETEPDEPATPAEAAGPRRRLGLELIEAAARGGYRLPEPVH
jgi:signal peptide peptidase SppA